MDHHDHHETLDGPWAGGWLVAAVAGLIAAIFARLFGDVGMAPAMVVGGMVFGVFAVLLGSGGVELNPPSHGDHDSHDTHHGHH